MFLLCIVQYCVDISSISSFYFIPVIHIGLWTASSFAGIKPYYFFSYDWTYIFVIIERVKYRKRYQIPIPILSRIGSKGNRTQPYWQHKDHSGIHILQPSMLHACYYKQPWTHSAAHSIMTIILYWLYPQATPEQEPLCQRKYQSTYWRWNALKIKKKTHKRSSEVLCSCNRASDGCGPHGDEVGWREHDLSLKRRLRTGFSSSIPKICSVLYSLPGFMWQHLGRTAEHSVHLHFRHCFSRTRSATVDWASCQMDIFRYCEVWPWDLSAAVCSFIHPLIFQTQLFRFWWEHMCFFNLWRHTLDPNFMYLICLVTCIYWLSLKLHL